MKECENINSRNKCQAMADGQTTSDSSTGKLAGFLDVVLLLSATFYLKIILRRQKISNFITKDNDSTAAILWSSRIPMLLAIQHDIRHNYPHSEKSFSQKKKKRIEEQASWRVSWSDSTAVSHYPSQNHFKMEKISTSRKFSRILLRKIIARLRKPCGLSNFFVIGDTTWFSIQPPPTRGKIVFTPPRNI